jgi:3-phenylpropionate/cinnamic acid dioxygenase small subunit
MLDKSARKPILPRVVIDLRPYEAFLTYEARLLDEGFFDDWVALFTEDARYWVPCEPDQQDPFETVSLMYDDRRLLETRVRRLSDPRIYSQEPRSRTSRSITNLSLEPEDCEHGEEQRLFAGTYIHRLVGEGEAMRIMMKKVNLVNCNAPLDGLVVPF